MRHVRYLAFLEADSALVEWHTELLSLCNFLYRKRFSMTDFMLVLHIAAAVLFIGPIMVATSAFPAQIFEAKSGNATAQGGASVLYRVTKVYGFLSALVPLLGLVLFLSDMDTYGSQGKFHASILLAIIARVILLVVILPRQRTALGALGMLPESEASPDEDKVGNWHS